MAIDPYRNYKYEVEAQGFVRAGFSKISGLKQTTESTDYREGGENETPHKLPGQTSFDDVTLERGMSNDDDFMNWTDQIFNVDNVDGEQGDEESFRKDLTIYLKNKAGRRVKKWKLLRTWPKERSYGDLDASSNDVLMETLVLCNEGISGPFSLT
jgi:phage tail-like protein